MKLLEEGFTNLIEYNMKSSPKTKKMERRM